MPIMRCTRAGKSGFKYGPTGKCYIGPGARSNAAAQGRAIQYSKHRNDASDDFLIQLKARRQQMFLGKRPKQIQVKRLPKMLYPTPVENTYNSRLQLYISEIGKKVEQLLIPNIESLILSRNEMLPTDMRMDDWSDEGVRLMNAVEISLADIPFSKEATANIIGDKTNAWHDKEWRKVLKSAFGVDIFQREPWLNQELSSFTKENVALITKMEDDLLRDIETTMQRSIKAGNKSGTVSKEIRERVNVSKSRARLIARDQTSKLNAQLNQLRQENIGVKNYIWRTSEDARVRPTHKANKGRVFSWNKPPDKTGHPGHDVQCRCYGEPVLEPIIQEVAPEQPSQLEESERTKELNEFRDQYPGRSGTSDFLIVGSAISRSGGTTYISRSGGKIVGASSYRRLRTRLSVSKLGAMTRHNTVTAKLTRRIARDAQSLNKGISLAKDIKNKTLFKKFGFSIRDNKLFAPVEKLDSITKKISRYISSRKPMRMTFRSFGDVPKKKVVVTPVKTKKASGTEKIIRKEEDNIRFIKEREFGVLFDDKGKVVKRYRGEENGIVIPDADLPLFKNKIFTHNHSNNTSFSAPDITSALSGNYFEIRATSPQYLHTATRAKGALSWSDNIPKTWIPRPGIEMKLKEKLSNETINQFNEEWLKLVMKEHTKINNELLLKYKGSLSNDVFDTIMPEATHRVAQRLAKDFGFVYSRTKIGAAVVTKPVPKIKTISELRSEAVKFKNKLDPKLLESIKDYTGESMSYAKVNAYLYGEKVRDFLEKPIKQMIQNFDKIFKLNYPKYKGISYRGMGFGYSLEDKLKYQKFMKNIKIGKTVNFPSYTSSSLSYDKANESIVGKFQLMFRIQGKDGFFIHDVFTNMKDEEILFNRNTSFKVTDLTKSRMKGTDGLIIDLKEI